jgi:DNA replication and repair protein RecF
VLVNGKRAARAEVAALVALVAFLPDDLDLVKRGPAYRREYLDDLTAQMWPAAAAERSDYERALRQRNALLRREGRHADPPTLDVLDCRVAALGSLVVRRRLDVLQRLVPVLAGVYADLGEQPEPVTWGYQGAGLGEVEEVSPAAELESRLGEAIAEARPVDLERRMTTVGPHRDELALGLGDRDARTRASQGEQRTLALGLRLAAYDLLHEQRGAAPVLVLDDVFSEMDASRTARLVERLPGGQVFVSTAREEDVPVHGTRWLVGGGTVSGGGVV